MEMEMEIITYIFNGGFAVGVATYLLFRVEGKIDKLENRINKIIENKLQGETNGNDR